MFFSVALNHAPFFWGGEFYFEKYVCCDLMSQIGWQVMVLTTSWVLFDFMVLPA